MTTTTTTTTAAASAEKTTPVYRPSLRFFHPNGRGTGCAVKLALHPAHDLTDGSIMLTAASQMTVGDRRGPNPTFPRFDWENSICVKLDFSDLCKILQVLRGECESIDDDHGLFHQSARARTKIVFRHLLEPSTGYSLELYRTTSENEESRAHMFFTPWEALGLAEAIAGSMAVVSFGIPVVIPRDTSAYEAENRGLRHASAA